MNDAQDRVSMAMSLRGILHFVDRKHGYLRRIANRSRAALALLARVARLLLVKANLSKKTVLILRCAEGSDVAGFFSEFTAIVGLLEHYETWKPIYAGVKVDFEDRGLYYDPEFGDNSWEYFFQPINFGCEANVVTKVVCPRQHDNFAFSAEGMSRKRGRELIDRYVHLRPQLQEKIDAYVSSHFAGSHVIGIHYRGTDKYQEAPRVPYEMVLAAVRERIDGIKTARYMLFLATDEQAFLDCMLERYPDRLNYLEMFRSVDGMPIHERRENNYKKGEDAVMDCLLLSRCHYLIRTASNLGLCAALFNPAVPQIVLNSSR